MKHFLGMMVLVAVVLGCSLSKKEGPSKSGTTTSPSNSTSSSASLTLEQFNQLTDGMKYEAVCRILGGEGTETSSFSSGPMKTVTYKWEGGNHARITVVFKDGGLSSKIQSNLKSDGSERVAAADLTFDKYSQIQTGMSYDEVVKIVGSSGTQTSSSDLGRSKLTSYKWEGASYAKIFATFRDDKLFSKSQSNLK